MVPSAAAAAAVAGEMQQQHQHQHGDATLALIQSATLDCSCCRRRRSGQRIIDDLSSLTLCDSAGTTY